MKQNITSGINLEDRAQRPSISNIDLLRDLQPTTIEDLDTATKGERVSVYCSTKRYNAFE